jgi:hypothetical protein
MRRRRPHKDQQRPAQIEPLEPRLPLTAQPAGDFQIEELFADASANGTVGDQHLPDLDQLAIAAGKVSSVRQSQTNYGFTGRGQTVAILDSGVAYDHPALGGGFGDGYRVAGGWDFGEDDADPNDPGTSRGHGTHVAGIIGGNDARHPGLASEVDFVALRVYNNIGAGYFRWVKDALNWVHEHQNDFRFPITTVNLSLGADWNSDSIPNWAQIEDELAQLEDDGIFIAVAAGNSFVRHNAPGLGYPAVSPNVVPVSSVDADGSLSYFSQRHQRAIAAPGRDIVSTVPDRLGNQDGILNDFAPSTGTSEAAPFVAGASVLLRQAFDFVGQSQVTQDDIYDVMMATADQIWDERTDQYYSRLNLDAAIEYIMPDDDFGSSEATAKRLGAVSASAKSVSGTIGRLGDVDFFRFVAGQSGVASLRLASDAGVDFGDVKGADSVQRGDDGQLLFEVVAGQEYIVGVEAGNQLAHYEMSIDVNLPAQALDLGVVDFHAIENLRLEGESWYRVAAQRTGTLTVDARFRNAAGDVNLEIYDGSRTIMASSGSRSNIERIDVDVRAGDELLVRVVGNNPNVDLRITNLVTRSGNRVVVQGTDSQDDFRFRTGALHSVDVNGVRYRFNIEQVSQVEFDGGGGEDSIVMSGTAGRERAVLRPGEATLSGDAVRAIARAVENVRLQSGGGRDSVRFHDTHGDEVFNADARSARMRGVNFVHRAFGFSVVQAYASDGRDRAMLSDSRGDDDFIGRDTHSIFKGTGFYLYVAGFDTVSARSRYGDDRAVFHDATGDQRFVSRQTASYIRGDNYYIHGQGFSQVDALATHGGHDQAQFYDVKRLDRATGRDDTFQVVSDQMQRSTRGFDFVGARAVPSGGPTVEIAAVDFAFAKFGDWES